MIVCVLLAFAMIVPLASCSGSSNDEAAINNSNNNGSVVTSPSYNYDAETSANTEYITETESAPVTEPVTEQTPVTEARCYHPLVEWTVTKEATCGEAGSQSGVCPDCNETVTQTIAQLTTHDTSAPICSVCGTKNYSKGLTFALNADGESYYVKGYQGYTDLRVIVPATYNGLPVTAIGDRAFDGCRDITYVSLTKNIIRIGNDAFANCFDLNYYEQDGAKYLSCGHRFNVLIDIVDQYHSITSFTIPVGTAFIYNEAFTKCSKLTTIRNESSELVQIGDQAFYGCFALESFSVPSTVKSIGSMAFSMTSLKSFTLPADIEYLKSDSLLGLSSTLKREHNGLLYIGTASNPYYCLMGTAAANEEEPVYPDTYTVHAETRIIAQKAFSPNSAPNGTTKTFDLSAAYALETIGTHAFEDCTAMTTLLLPESLKGIETNAFSDCSALTEVTIPASVTYIGSGAFSGCSSLTIYADFTEMPASWDSRWNSSNRPVNWKVEPIIN